jgi:hypothetical protein
MGDRTHAPDFAFGCFTMWGPTFNAAGRSDMPLHVCNKPDGHNGRHLCSCGVAVSDRARRRFRNG